MKRYRLSYDLNPKWLDIEVEAENEQEAELKGDKKLMEEIEMLTVSDFDVDIEEVEEDES
jgi:hypothetical protein